jgi:Flp pilus assembly protein TadB
MLIVSILAFFVVVFLLASIAVTLAWMGFLKTTAEESDAARRDLESTDDDDSALFRSERLSTLTFWDALLVRFDFIEILRARIGQADLSWSVGRVTLAMLLCGLVTFVSMMKFVIVWAAVGGAVLVAFAGSRSPPSST